MEFASKGFGGARTESIVARTNTNTAMLFHYFGSKENLYIAVLESIYDDIRRKEAEIKFDTMTPVVAIQTLIRFTFNYYIEQPHFVRMINNENQHEIAFLKKSDKIARANTSIIEALQKIVDRGVDNGEFGPELMSRTSISVFRLSASHMFPTDTHSAWCSGVIFSHARRLIVDFPR